VKNFRAEPDARLFMSGVGFARRFCHLLLIENSVRASVGAIPLLGGCCPKDSCLQFPSGGVTETVSIPAHSRASLRDVFQGVPCPSPAVMRCQLRANHFIPPLRVTGGEGVLVPGTPLAHGARAEAILTGLHGHRSDNWFRMNARFFGHFRAWGAYPPHQHLS
jgi:hypothetical protein